MFHYIQPHGLNINILKLFFTFKYFIIFSSYSLFDIVAFHCEMLII